VGAGEPGVDVELLEDLGEVATVPPDEGGVGVVDGGVDVADAGLDGSGDLGSVVLGDPV
jgi:hypothetical protein